MNKKNFLHCLILSGLCLFGNNSFASIEQTEALNKFIDKMSVQHQFDRTQLERLFRSVEIKESILKAISAPAEGMPWYKYRKIFLTDSRIDGGVKFWQDNAAVLSAVQDQTGVPAEIIVAIIGVETRYGGNTGNYRVIDALSTLGFAYPKRSQFFLSELEHFLLLCREQQMDPLLPTGSYAGAMGLPQFMPSSYRTYAADFEGDHKQDIWNNPADVIASVANYFVKHHWHPGEDIAFQVRVRDESYKDALNSDLKPNSTIGRLKSLNVSLPAQLADPVSVKLLEFEMENGLQQWIGLHNFYVITRYNHSPLYAMAVFQLSQAIRDRKSLRSNHKPVF